MLKENLEQVIAMGTSTPYSENIYAARKEYQKLSGEIYEDDKSYESRMGMFLEWYVFDRVDPSKDLTIFESIINENRETWPQFLLEIYEGFTTNIHGLFYIKKIRNESVSVVNLFDNEKYDVVEPDAKLHFNKNDLFEGRLVPYQNAYHFTGNFCFHPGKAEKFIRKQIDQLCINQIAYKKELIIKNSQLADDNKMLHKINVKIEKLKSKLLKSTSESKTSKLKMEIAEVETKRTDLETKVSHLKNEIKLFTHEKIVREGKVTYHLLLQKLSYMHLIWERSRQIDLEDIYRT